MKRFLNTSDDIPGKCVAEMYTLAFFPKGEKLTKFLVNLKVVKVKNLLIGNGSRKHQMPWGKATK